MKDIPVHLLKDRATSGLEIDRFLEGDKPKEDEPRGAHRDDHYIFFVIEGGSASLMIDFNEIEFQPANLYYVLPGQVHHRIKNDGAYGWFIAVDTMLVPPAYRNIFESELLLQQPHCLSEVQMQQCKSLLNLLYERYLEDEQGIFYLSIVHSLVQSFLGIAAGCFSDTGNPRLQMSRPLQLAQEFKKLLVAHVRTLKSPSAYAAKLNVSETYLNEALKKTTGLSVSYWIQQEIMLEAKRLLYYSQLNVKEIAHTLGYEDHAYFSRLFKKAEGITPLAFRADYRK
ncbi:helix-turn-helix domain-containing protein [Mucilaginibacter sp. FT3.2]|uniref:helix-turn-helix domain-containing protein n=1 Tax=Mucilaginibacter sp. FT3.2 TaxID=2723090 RepID=UPI00160DD826|nr:helix-turn-helix domain-containing protein [Mucilaginibacter sp. FT3.2]MBB6231471.1 AraC-like DNA-binding protein [Mucilaginibacter sp. FT3.2]